jgi:protein farnesyltransferase subunit beta
MYQFFMNLKQKDGSFLVASHGEVDVRGIYCLLVTATLLDIITPELLEGTAGFIASCQTYEGGFASSSQPYFSAGEPSKLLGWPHPPLGEAHGGYTFCSLASWVILQPFMNYPNSSTKEKPSIDIQNLIRWLVQMQGNDIELGGFKGRTNKLVDGCYSWWCGGSFSLLEALGVPSHADLLDDNQAEEEFEELWDDIDDVLYNREALQRYILFACQHSAGGLRDKPPKNPDAYHTVSCLSGLSSAQHRVAPSATRRAEILGQWKPGTSQFWMCFAKSSDVNGV